VTSLCSAVDFQPHDSHHHFRYFFLSWPLNWTPDLMHYVDDASKLPRTKQEKLPRVGIDFCPGVEPVRCSEYITEDRRQRPKTCRKRRGESDVEGSRRTRSSRQSFVVIFSSMQVRGPLTSPPPAAATCTTRRVKIVTPDRRTATNIE